jgi:hypothetical protein
MLRSATLHRPRFRLSAHSTSDGNYVQRIDPGTRPVRKLRTLIYSFSSFVLIKRHHQVVQYILDLNDNRFSDAVIRQFIGNVCALSVQKFSSNVIEKVCAVSSYTNCLILIIGMFLAVHPCGGA